MKKLLALTIGLMLTCVSFADSNEDVLKKLQEMQEQIQKQQAEISGLRSELKETATKQEVANQIQKEVNAAIDTTSWSQSKDVAAVTLQKHIKELKVKGDLRLRYERQERDLHRDTLPVSNSHYDPDYNEETRDRFRTRLRIGLEWKTNEGWDIGIGVATGGSESTSTNDTWSDGDTFETGDLRLDYAYAKHKVISQEDFSLTATLGQQKNPFKSSSIFWDGDIRPIGVTLMAEFGGAFVTAGAYDVRDGGRDSASAGLYAAQVGWSGAVAEGNELTIASAFYHFSDPTTDGMGLDNDFSFDIGDLYGAYDVKLGEVSLGFEGHVWKNFGATGSKGQTHASGDDTSNIDPDSADMGYALGISAKVSKFSFGYMYGHVEADSVYSEIKDSDFGDTAGLTDTDVEGHKFSAGYKVTKNMSIGMTYMMLHEIDGHDRDGELYQLDFGYKF